MREHDYSSREDKPCYHLTTWRRSHNAQRITGNRDKGVLHSSKSLDQGTHQADHRGHPKLQFEVETSSSQAQDILRGERPSLRMKKITLRRHLGCTIVPESRGIGIRDHRAGRSPGYDCRIGLERGGNQHERLKVKSRQCGRRVRRLGVKAGGLDPKDGNG